MPRTTIADACRQRGIDRKDWDEAKRQGIDPWDRKAMDKWAKSRRHRIKPGTKLPDDSPTIDAQTVAQMEDAIKRARSIDEVKILREKVTALKTAVEVQRITRDLVPIGDVQQSITRVVSGARAEILKLAADLPPRLEGLSASKMQRIIREMIVATLTRLSDEANELYQQ